MSNLKRFLALTMAMLMVVGVMATASAKTFADVADDAASAEAVDVLSELGVILGTSADEFSPDALVERQQMAMFIARLATAQPALFAGTAGTIFADQKDPVYNAAIQYAYTNGIIAGRTATTFDGPATVTLQEAAAMLARAVGYGSKANDTAYPFSYMVIANEIGLLEGLEDVAPTAALTRGEVAIMLYNALYAPRADRELIFSVNGQDFVVSVPEEFTDNDDTTDYDTLASKTWKFEAYYTAIVATKDFTLDTTTANPSKSITDPVIIPGYNNDKEVSFAAIAKYLPEDVTANELLGVKLLVLAKGTKIIKIDVVGDVETFETATYALGANNAVGGNDDTLTVDGTTYKVDAHSFTADYPADTDNCFYVYSGNQIVRVTSAAQLSNIANGWFELVVINGGTDEQMIVYKELKFAKVTDANNDGVLELDTKNITSNVPGAKKDDYVVYFSNGANLVEVKGVAVKSAAQKVVTVNNTSKVATFDTGATAPFNATPITGSSLLSALTIGTSYYTYSVDGKVLMTTTVDSSATAYAPKAYYAVVAAERVVGDFGAITYRVKLVDTAGVETVKVITKVDAALATTFASDADFKTAINGKIVTVDAAHASIVYTSATSANFFTTFNNVTDTAPSLAGLTAFTKSTTNANLFTLDATNDVSVVLADYSKIVVKVSDGYVVVSGKSFNGLVGTLVPATSYAITRVNEAGMTELVYAFIDAGAATKANVLAGGTATTTLKPYIFLSAEEESLTTVKYNVFNIVTGTVEQVVYTGKDEAAKNDIKAAITTATDASITAYDVQSFTAAPASTGLVTPFKFAAGYVVTNGAPYTLNNTKFYQWDAANDKLVAKTAADFAAGKSYEGIVIVDNTANATYVIVGAETVTTAVTATPATGSTIALTGATVTLTAETGATVYYTLDGTDPTTSSTSVASGTSVAIADGTAATTVTVKAFAVIAGENASAIATFTFTRA